MKLILFQRFTINFCGFSLQEGIDFFQEKRTHIQQGFVELEADYRTFLNNLLKTSPEILRALIGCKLNQTERLKLDNTVLATILEEEIDSFPDLTGLETDLNEDEISDNSEDEETNDLLNEAQNVMQFIANQMKSNVSEPNLESNENIQKNELDDELTPYTSDIEYLEDLFSLHAAIMKKKICRNG